MIDFQTIRGWECQVWRYTVTHNLLLLRIHDREKSHDSDGWRREYFVVCIWCKELPRLQRWSMAKMRKRRIDESITRLWDETTGVSIECELAYVNLRYDTFIDFAHQPLWSPNLKGYENAPDDVLPDSRDRPGEEERQPPVAHPERFEWALPVHARHKTWILYRYNVESGRSLRERYAGLPCQGCGKFDEIAAVRSGIDRDVVFPVELDYFNTDDGFACVGSRLRDYLETRQVQGCEFLELPGDPRYSLCLPAVEIPVDRDLCEMWSYHECELCGRARETTGNPNLASMAATLPARNALVFPNVRIEERLGRSMLPLFTGDLADALRSSEFRGFVFYKAE